MAGTVRSVGAMPNESPSRNARFAQFMRPDLAPLTPVEETASLIVVGVPAVAGAVLDWSIWLLLVALLPGIALVWFLRIRAAKTRERRQALPASTAIVVGGAAGVGGSGSPLDRYYGLLAVAMLFITERQLRTQPVSTPESRAARGDSYAGSGAAVLRSHTFQAAGLTILAVLTWGATMAATQVSACASPADGGSVHGPQGAFTKAFCGTAGAASSMTGAAYLLLLGIPLIALVVGLIAVVRMHGGPKRALMAAAPIVAPASVGVAWVLAGAR
jgi:hypothetical protein